MTQVVSSCTFGGYKNLSFDVVLVRTNSFVTTVKCRGSLVALVLLELVCRDDSP